MAKVDLGSLTPEQWAKIGEWLKACEAEAKKFIDRYDDATIGFVCAVLWGAGGYEVGAKLVNDKKMYDIGFEVGLGLRPWVKSAVMAWLIPMIGKKVKVGG